MSCSNKTREEPLLEVQEISKSFEGRCVLDRVTFSVSPGEIVGLLGPNGAGKTTAFYAVIGLVRLDRGSVFFRKRQVELLPTPERARMGMGFLAQEPSIFRELTVEQNLQAVLEFQLTDRQEIQKRSQEALKELELWQERKTKAAVLSGGQRRRLEIARTLALKPQFILLDEPFANVDPLTIEGLKKMIQTLAKRGIAILITDHNAREIFSIADHCYLLTQGVVLASGPPQKLCQDPLVIERYLGEGFSF